MSKPYLILYSTISDKCDNIHYNDWLRTILFNNYNIAYIYDSYNDNKTQIFSITNNLLNLLNNEAVNNVFINNVFHLEIINFLIKDNKEITKNIIDNKPVECLMSIITSLINKLNDKYEVKVVITYDKEDNEFENLLDSIVKNNFDIFKNMFEPKNIKELFSKIIYLYYFKTLSKSVNIDLVTSDILKEYIDNLINSKDSLF